MEQVFDSLNACIFELCNLYNDMILSTHARLLQVAYI